MRVSIEIDLPDDHTRHDLAWSLRDVANRVAQNRMSDVEQVRSPWLDVIGTVVIS